MVARTTIPLLVLLWLAAPASRAADPPAGPPRPDFVRDVMPVLVKSGCNGGSCHGSFQGRGGFQLSLFGFDSQFDYAALVQEGRQRRVFLPAPDHSLVLRSLVLRKPLQVLPHVVGRAQTNSGELARPALPLSHLTWGEPNRFRAGIRSRAVVARPQGLPLEAAVDQVTAKPGGTVEIPLAIPEGVEPPDGPVSLSINRTGTHFKCTFGPPVKVTFQDRAGTLRFPLPAAFTAGRSYDLLVANAWTSETRKGLPGPCTRLVRVTVAER